MSGYDWLVGAVIVFAVPTLLALTLIMLPEKIVRLQGRFYRLWYKQHLEMSDEALDSFPQLPWDTWMMGSRSHFIANSENAPHLFPRLLAAHRRTGYTILVVVIAALLLTIWGTATGKSVTGK